MLMFDPQIQHIWEAKESERTADGFLAPAQRTVFDAFLDLFHVLATKLRTQDYARFTGDIQVTMTPLVIPELGLSTG